MKWACLILAVALIAFWYDSDNTYSKKFHSVVETMVDANSAKPPPPPPPPPPPQPKVVNSQPDLPPAALTNDALIKSHNGTANVPNAHHDVNDVFGK